MSKLNVIGACSICSLLALIFSMVNYAQQPEQQTPKRLVLKPLPAGSEPPEAGPVQIESLEIFAARLLHHAPEAGCHSPSCKILVTDFVFPSGFTCLAGMSWADKLSALFETQGKRVVDRTILRGLLQKQGISSQTANTEGSARWLGGELDTTVALVGQAKMIKSNVVELSARFVNVEHGDLIGPGSDVDLGLDTSADLSPMNGLALPMPLPPFPEIVNGEKVYLPGTHGLRMANCYYMPNPPYTESARKSKFNGTVTAQGVIGSDEIIRALRIVKGAPYGLNENVIAALKTWKCRPAQLDGKPVAVLVPFEVNFRLYGGAGQ